jgi:hypothetical protein
VPEGMGPRPWVGSVVVSCRALAPMMAFWSEVLRYHPREAAEEDGVVLTDPRGVGPNLTLMVTGEAPLAEYRLHLDLYSSEPEAEVARLVALGATVRGERAEGTDFTTLADPEGNLFDVVDKRGWTPGRRA